MDRIFNITKALADPGRLRILMALRREPELCACQLIGLLRLAPATVSRHLGVLQHAGLIRGRKEGRWIHYRLADNAPEPLLAWLEAEMEPTEAFVADRARLARILACDKDALCASQRATPNADGDDPLAAAESCCH